MDGKKLAMSVVVGTLLLVAIIFLVFQLYFILN